MTPAITPELAGQLRPISPRSADWLASHPWVPTCRDEAYVDIHHVRYSVVGRAWGSTHRYALEGHPDFCAECRDAAGDMADQSDDNGAFGKALQKWITHWNACHAKREAEE